MPGALPVGESSTRELYNTQSGDGIQPPGGSSNYPEGLVGANGAAGPSAQSDVHAHSILNLPPGEAARRWEVAIKLLNDSNLDPRTLSTEQFSIFANQSPELQQDSLAMLVKYGAERLRIVHPDKNEPDSSEPSPNPPAPELVEVTPQPEAPKKKSRNKTAEGAEGGNKNERLRICNNCRRRRFTGKVCTPFTNCKGFKRLTEYSSATKESRLAPCVSNWASNAFTLPLRQKRRPRNPPPMPWTKPVPRRQKRNQRCWATQVSLSSQLLSRLATRPANSRIIPPMNRVLCRTTTTAVLIQH